MQKENYGSQQGNGSINVGVGDFRGANVNIGGARKPTFTSEQIQIKRHPALGGRKIKANSLSTFGIVTGLASLLGLYFSLFSPFSKPISASWSSLFLFSLAIASICFATSGLLKRKKFEFFFRKYYLECGSREGIYLTSLTATCPWCGSKMKLRNIKSANKQSQDIFFCERNSTHHTILLDPTFLCEIAEE
ncbi:MULTISPECIES: hypothetical protein [Achromobacter]|uniref:hypothetical protein n=1 Tax=Achromobacter TaxID=222 RepID=UPI00118755C0|nr:MULTISPECIES: hypothetical protein [Achromobacter]MCH4583310.1 hypothetical protein [Achromobacter xylosoxidans]MCZ8433917.1 hypothetical protein [Achromobacter ruhlandii]MDC6089053.1 hypothetical protein [Achromobacter ruhlandii]MDC6152310.1 hypothetical protein [Achromobacter ruhlandii]MDD7982412.1 hypothetical protein [Achromobacter ruhlandii]